MTRDTPTVTPERVERLTAEEEEGIRRIAEAWRHPPSVVVDSGYAGLAIQRLLVTLDAVRSEAGHRIAEPHDCFLMNCRDLGDELRNLRDSLQ